MKKEPTKIKLSETPLSSKDVKRIPLPPLYDNRYDITMNDDIYIRLDKDSTYAPTKNEDNPQDNS